MSNGAHRRRSARPSKVLLSVVAVAAATGTVATVMLLVRPDSVEPASSTTSSNPAPRPEPAPLFPGTPPLGFTPATETPAVEAPPPPPAPVTTPVVAPPAVTVVEPPELTAVVAPEPAPAPTPTLGANEPEMTVVNPVPATRAPLSVEPEPRPAFPNQEPPELGDDGGRGGLLGGGGLL